jgi:hypothetical protein
MNRRDLLKSLALVPPAIAVPASRAVAKHGFLDVRGHRAHQQATGEFLRVTIDGVDVTSQCFEADDVEGYVRVFCRDEAHHSDLRARGSLHIKRGPEGVCKFEVHGNVVIKPGEKI